MIRIWLPVALSVGSIAVAVGQSSPPPEPSAAQKIVLSYFHDVLDQGKAELLDSMFLPDAVIHRPEGELRGTAGLRKMLQGRTWATFSTKVHDIFEAGDRVVVRLTHTGQGVGIYPFRIGSKDIGGKTVTWDAIAIFRMQNGKVAEEWVNRDELGMLLSAGVLQAGSGAR
jgi:predicted ester cyclase